MDNSNSLKITSLEEVLSKEELLLLPKEKFLLHLANIFAHKDIKNQLKIPRVVSVYSLRENYETTLKTFKEYLEIELKKDYGNNGECPRVVISKQAEPNTYSIPVDYYTESRRIPGFLPPPLENGRAEYIYPPNERDRAEELAGH